MFGCTFIFFIFFILLLFKVNIQIFFFIKACLIPIVTFIILFAKNKFENDFQKTNKQQNKNWF